MLFYSASHKLLFDVEEGATQIALPAATVALKQVAAWFFDSRGGPRTAFIGLLEKCGDFAATRSERFCQMR